MGPPYCSASLRRRPHKQALGVTKRKIMKSILCKGGLLLLFAFPLFSHANKESDRYLDEILKANNIYFQVQQKVNDWKSKASVTNHYTTNKLRQDAKNNNIELPEEFWKEQKILFKEFKAKMKNIVPNIDEVLNFWKSKLKNELTTNEIKEIHSFLKSKIGAKYTSAIQNSSQKFGMEIHDKYLFKIESAVREFNNNVHELSSKYGLEK